MSNPEDTKCKTHPDAPHGFDRNASLSEDRYVCECEYWEPPSISNDELIAELERENNMLRARNERLEKEAAERDRLAQPEPEPVAIGEEWKPCMKLPIVVHVREQRKSETHVGTREGITPVKEDDLIMRGVAGEEYPIGRELFNRTYTFNTAPPKREWVGLTEADIYDAMNNEDEFDFAEAIEAKLKEKNG